MLRVSTTCGLILSCSLLLSGAPQVKQPPAGALKTLRATLSNGLEVVILQSPLAPVATIELNYRVGGDETPAGFPGMAHAQEHMAFRGCEGLTTDQTAAIFAQLGGQDNADTQQNITQYFTTVPTADLDIALRVEAACMRNISDSQTDWANERGAIEQEVARDLSNPTYKFLTRLNEDMFAGTPYAHDPLGTKASFDATTGAMLKAFHDRWYAPNNAILVISGDVDGNATLAQIRSLFESIPRHDLPARTPVDLKPVKAETFTLDSDLGYTLAFIGYRMPGTDSPDYAAAEILGDVLSSQRGELYGLVPQGKALAAEFGMAETYPKASVGFAMAALPAGTDTSGVIADMKRIIARQVMDGISPELIEASKRGEVAQAEFERNSIPGLAETWSKALAAESRTSPDQDVEAIKAVTVADVNRVAKKYLLEQNTVIATLKPVPSGAPVASKGFGGNEKLTSEPTKPVALPEWAAAKLASLSVPQEKLSVSDETLPNGIRLIVDTERITPTVTVMGNIRNDSDLETPPGKEGVSDVLDQLLGYGTRTLDRLAFQKALDDIAADESAGFNFSVRVLKSNFSRGVQLLADNELNPALPAAAFGIISRQVGELAEGELSSPAYRAGRAVTLGLVPANDPETREVTPKSVAKVTLDDVVQYYHKTVRPDLTTIVVIGDVSADEAKREISKWFGDWKATGPQPEVTLPPVSENKTSAVNVPDPSQLQDTVTLAEEVQMNRYNPDYYALQLGNHVLGGGFYATRLYRDLRQKTGYVYNVNAELQAGRSRTTYSVIFGCDPANVSKARDLIGRDLADMQSTPVGPEELRQAKALLLRQIPLQESSENSIAGGLLARAQMKLPLNEPVQAADRYFKLTADEVQTAFRKWIRPQGFVEVVRGPAPE